MLNYFDSPERNVPPSESFPKVTGENSQNTQWVNPLVLVEVGILPAAIMPQCFQRNVTAIVNQDDSHWEDSPLPPHPFSANTIQCAALYVWRHATVFVASDPVTASWDQDNEKDDTEVIS